MPIEDILEPKQEGRNIGFKIIQISKRDVLKLTEHPEFKPHSPLACTCFIPYKRTAGNYERKCVSLGTWQYYSLVRVKDRDWIMPTFIMDKWGKCTKAIH